MGMRLHRRYVRFEVSIFQRHFVGKLTIGGVVREKYDVYEWKVRRIFPNFLDVFSVPVGSDTDGAIIPVVGGFTRTSLDVSIL